MGYRVLLFSTEYCANCRMTKPVVLDACSAKGIEVVEIDPTKEPDGLIDMWQLKQVPTVIAVATYDCGENGREIARQTGGMTPSAMDEFLLHADRMTAKDVNERNGTS